MAEGRVADTSVSGSAGDVARDAAAAATARGRADRGGVSPADKVLRDVAIMASLHAGVAVGEVAKEFDLTARSVRRIQKGWVERPTALDKRPMEIVERLLRTYEDQLRAFAAMAVDCRERAPAVAIAALKGHSSSLERYTLLLSSVGKLPSNLELFRAESEMRQLARAMADAVRRAEAGELSVVELGEFFDSLVGASQRWEPRESAGLLGAGEAA